MSMRPAFLVILALGLAASCDDSVTYEFKATGLATTAGETAARNDVVGIRFSAELDAAGPSSDAVRVTTAAGVRVPVRLSITGDVLNVEPADAEGWPADQTLTLEIPHPPLGRPLRSRDGAAHAGGFVGTIKTGASYAKRGGDLRVSTDLVNGLKVWSAQAAFRFDFDGPVDPATVAEAVRVHDVEAGRAAAGAAVKLVRPDRLVVAPFERGGFRGGASFRIEISRGLRGLDGRRPAAATSWTFSTAKGRGGEHVTEFRPEDLVDPSLKPDAGPLRPTPRTLFAVLAPDASRAGPAAFGGGPFRMQTIIPGEALGTEEATIDRILVPVAVAGGVETVLESLEIRLGEPSAEALEELDPAFEQNWAGTPTTCPLADAGRDGAFLVRPEADGRVELRLARPYLRAATDAQGLPRALLLEISAGAPIVPDGPIIALRGWDDPAGVTRSVTALDATSPRGTPSTFEPALQIMTTQFAPVVLKPWTADVPEPRYFERPDAVRGKGRPFEDFTVEYRALTPSDHGGEPLDATPWSPRLSELHGFRTVQARIVFHPRPLGPGAPRPELERLTLSFVADG